MPAHETHSGFGGRESVQLTVKTAGASRPKSIVLLSVAAATALLLSACGEAGAGDDGARAGGSEAAGGQQIVDDHGTHTLPDEVVSVGATDNRSFRTLEAFGVELSVAPRDLMDEQIHGYAENEDILNLGNHREPDLEQIVAAAPDLVINGQRYSQYYGEISDLLDDDSVILEWEEALNNPATFHEGLIEQTGKLGEVFDAEDEANELIDGFEEQLDRVDASYDGESSVMALMTSGGDIQYVAPGDGRILGPLFDVFDLVPALEQGVEDDAHADDVSVEAIADAEPDWLLVIDRDARIDSEDEEYRPADELISESPALQNVPAVENGNIVYTPDEMYLTEDIQAYTTFLSDFADALESVG